MRLGRRTVYCLLMALISLNLLLRFPRTGHEAGVDSYFVHALATSISDTGRMPWILNPLGYFGWYPLSYPGAGPVIISGVSLVSGIPEEGAILALSLLYSVIAVLAGFVMARAFWRDDVFALTVALIFSLAPRLMSFTLWSASTRNLFMVFIPVFLWALVRAFRKPTAPHLLVLLAVLVIMLATHRLTILLAVVILAFVAAYVFVLAHRVIRIRIPRVLLSPAFRRWTPWLALLGIFLIAAFMLFGTEILDEYAEGEICSGSSTEAKVCNLGVSITRSVGLALPFALVGIFTVVRQHNRGFLEVFLALSLLALVPTLFLRQYTGFYILPFLALFAGFGVIGVTRAARKRTLASKAILVASILAITGFSIGVLEVEVERSTTMSDASYSASLYLMSLPKGNWVANDGLLGIRTAAISGRQGLPVGGAGTTYQSPEILIIGAYNATEVFQREHRILLTELTIEDDSPFLLLGIDALNDWAVKIMKNSIEDINPGVVDRYDLTYYLENDAFRDAYVAFGNVYDARRYPDLVVFPVSVHRDRYKIYDGTTEDIYWVWVR